MKETLSVRSALLACVLVLGTSCRTPLQEPSGGSTAAGERNLVATPQVKEPAAGSGKKRPAAAPKESVRWSPPDPSPDDWDWIRLKSGEWLKGDIEILRRGDLEFDSDELDELKIEWDKVVELRSPRMNSLLFEDGERVQGTLLIRDDVIVVRDREGTEHRFERRTLLTLIPGEAEELDYWSGTVAFGLAARAGNTDQKEYSGELHLLRRALWSRYALNYDGNYGKVDGERNTNNHRLLTKFDLFVDRRLFFTPLFFEAYRDTFQNIDYRLTQALGVGYKVFDEEDIEWEVEVAAGYQFIEYRSVESGEDSSDEDSVLIGMSTFEFDITEDVEYTLEYIIQKTSSDLSKADHNARTGLSIDIVDPVDLNVMFTWKRVGDPEREASGDRPEKNDYLLTVGFEVEF